MYSQFQSSCLHIFGKRDTDNQSRCKTIWARLRGFPQVDRPMMIAGAQREVDTWLLIPGNTRD